MLIIMVCLYIAPADLSQFLADFHVISVATRQRDGNTPEHETRLGLAA